jgi:hypothetical protein
MSQSSKFHEENYSTDAQLSWGMGDTDGPAKLYCLLVWFFENTALKGSEI